MTLEIITSNLLRDARHGFFTRRGGASSGVFDGLNCGPGSSDQTDVVAINRARVAEAMGASPDNLVTVSQVHSAEVVTVDAPFETGRPDADALVSATPGLVLAILTADCLPALFADTEAGVVGAAHAGWKGAKAGVLEATLDAMAALGADRKRIRVALGPAISQSCYEVGPEFFEDFIAEDDANSRHFANGTNDRMQFDLPGYALGRLRGAGVAEAGWTRHCTYADPERFFSYRRSVHRKEADYGRLISVIRL